MPARKVTTPSPAKPARSRAQISKDEIDSDWSINANNTVYTHSLHPEPHYTRLGRLCASSRGVKVSRGKGSGKVTCFKVEVDAEGKQMYYYLQPKNFCDLAAPPIGITKWVVHPNLWQLWEDVPPSMMTVGKWLEDYIKSELLTTDDDAELDESADLGPVSCSSAEVATDIAQAGLEGEPTRKQLFGNSEGGTVFNESDEDEDETGNVASASELLLSQRKGNLQYCVMNMCLVEHFLTKIVEYYREFVIIRYELQFVDV
jgi:hypothetical protein